MQINQTSFEYSSTSLKVTVQSGAKPAQSGQTAPKSEVDAYLPTANGTPNTSVVEQMKADLDTRQQHLLELVREMLAKQGIQVTAGEGVWKTLAEGNFMVDAETKQAAQAAIADDGYWGVPQTSQRLVNFAKALVGGDPSKAGMMREAFIKGFKEAEKAWGGKLPEITQRTYDAVMKLFDEWEYGTSAEEAAPAQTGSYTAITVEYERTVISAKSLNITANTQEAEQLSKSDLFDSLSEPLKHNGLTLNSAWCMNEKLSVTILLGNGALETQRPSLSQGQDGFVPAPDRLRGTYGPNGKRVEHDRPQFHGPREMLLTFFKPMERDGKQHSLRVGGHEIPLHEDGTVTVGLPDGTMRRAVVNQEALDRAFQSGTAWQNE